VKLSWSYDVSFTWLSFLLTAILATGIECVMGFLESEQQMNATDSMSDCEVEEEKGAFDLPEMSKVRCSDCGQKFSGLWVLKSHKEEVHHQIMPER